MNAMSPITTGEPLPQTAHREFLLASMRTAVLNLKTWQHELEAIGVALRGNLISMDDACSWLDEVGLLRWLPDSGGEP